MKIASVFDEQTTKAWKKHCERQIAQLCVLTHLWELREGNDWNLFVVPEHEMSDAEIGKEFEATENNQKGNYRIIDIKYGYLFVREL